MEESDIEDEEVQEEETEDELDPNNPEDAFKILERDFNKTLAELESQPDAVQYADDFSKIFEAAFKLKVKEKELSDELQEKIETIAIQENRLEQYDELARKDRETIDDLKKNIVHVCRLADAAHYREQTSQEIIDNLRRQVESLNAEIDFKNKMAADSEDAGKSHKEKDMLQREKERLTTENGYLQQKLLNCTTYTLELEEKTSEANLKINELNGQVEDQGNEIERMKKFREKLEFEISALKNTIEEREVVIGELHKDINNQAKRINDQEYEVKQHKSSYLKLSKEFVTLEVKYTKIFHDHQKQVTMTEQAKKDLYTKMLDVKKLHEDVIHYRTEIANMNVQRDTMEKEVFKHITNSQKMLNDRNNLRGKIAMIEKELEEVKKMVNEHKKAVDEAIKEKNNITKTVAKAQGVNKEQARLIKIQEKAKEKLEQELDLFFIENNKQKKEIGSLQKEKDRYADAQVELTKKVEDLMDDIRQKKAYVFDLKRTIEEQLNRIRQQQNLYEAVRTERVGLQKALEQSSTEVDELKKKLRVTMYQTEQLKEDISTKEQELVKEETMMRKVVKEKENLKIEVDKGLEQIRSLRGDIRDMQDEEKRLHKTIMINQRALRDKTKTIEQLMNERDVLGSQLVRRNDELALNNDKLKILVTTLHRGESNYEQRLGDIRLLKIEVKRLRQEKLLMEKSMVNMIDFRQEVFRLERDLTTSKLKCRALEEELQNPVNIHRWRKLEGSDPETMELLRKIKILQKRLLHQSYEAVNREKQLKESEQLYIKLKQVISFQPGPAIKEELNKAEKLLKIKNDKLKVLLSELNMAELKSAQYKSGLEKVTDELKELKKKYIMIKKANRVRRMATESSREVNQTKSRESGSEVKFTGGGFRMSVPQISTK